MRILEAISQSPTRILFFLLLWGASALATALGYMRSVLNLIGFQEVDGKSIAIAAGGVLGSLLATRGLKATIPPNDWKVWQNGYLSLHLVVTMGLVSIGAYLVGSPVDSMRGLAAISLGVSSLWLSLAGTLPVLRLRLAHSAGWVLIGITFFLHLPFSLQSNGLDGKGRPMFRWRWGSQQATLILASEEKRHNESPSRPLDAVVGEPWLQFMGPSRNGVASPLIDSEQGIDPKFIELLWEKEIGPSWSSCVTDGLRIYTQEMVENQENLVALDLSTGERLFSIPLGEGFQSTIGGNGSRATPSLTDKNLFALTAMGRLISIDLIDKKEKWSHSLFDKPPNDLPKHGVCGSPLVVGDLVYVFPGSQEGRAVIAYDGKTGKEVYFGGSQESGYSSLTSFQIDGRPIIIAAGSHETVGYSMDLQTLLWRYPFTNSTNTICAQPQQVSPNEILVSSGYGTGSRRLKLIPSPDIQTPWTVEEVWKSRHLKTTFSSPIVFQEAVFGLDDGILQSVRLSDGSSRWKKARYGYGQLLLCGKVLVVQCEDGGLAAVDAESETFRELLRMPQLDGKTWNHPVWSRPYLILRNDRKIRCLKLAAPAHTSGRSQGAR